MDRRVLAHVGNRKLTQLLAAKKRDNFLHHVLNGVEDGLQATITKDKGRGVIAKRRYQRGDVVVEYSGKLISIAEAMELEAKFLSDTNIGCFMFYFQFKTRHYCIDATEETGRLGRLVNHSRTKSNCAVKVVEYNNQPRLVLVATKDITPGDEILFDYGDRRQTVLSYHPWLCH